jgi:hypothetical protein
MKNFMTLNRLLLTLGTFLLPLFGLLAQELPSNLDCVGSRTWIKQNFYDGKFTSLGYSTARKKMYAYIDNRNDSLICIYGGYRQYHLRGNETTSILPINCEHTIPQSFFNSSEPMVCDIHHLFPTYDNWNSVRANFPFADIPDAMTTQWMRNSASQIAIPTQVIDEWAEFNIRNSTFEPREQQKGNTARAIFYFYTVYSAQMASRPITQVASLETLLQWHTQDPPDAAERERNNRVQQYQGNRNPYIDRPEWVARAFFACTPSTNISDIFTQNTFALSPNPVVQEVKITMDLQRESAVKVLIFNSLGEQVYQKELGKQSAGQQEVCINTDMLQTGFYVMRLQTPNNEMGVMKKFFKL